VGVLGLPAGQNRLVAPDPAWALLYEEERLRLRSVLPSDARDIQHVGSTAVPGLRAKPIIDIAIGARGHTLADDWQGALAALGYDYPGDIGIPGHRIYGRDPGIRRFLVHVVDFGGPRWKDLLRFRDLLRSDPELARDYEAVKAEAAAKFPTGKRSDYTNAKSRFIEAVLHSEERPTRPQG
jgi:GrpB-like predicted nucleotidyltransferase (UPF0157 family)